MNAQADAAGGGATRRTLREGFRALLRLCNNPLSLLGLFIVTVSLLLAVTFFLFTVVTGKSNRYLDVVGFLILPGVFATGLAIVPVGVIWAHLRRRRGLEGVPRRLRIDLADARTRGAVAVFLGATFFIVLPALAVLSYEGYTFTESTEFCATVCHTVMKPEGTAHAGSPHARVTCAQCHIGEGAGWFVKAKLSGLRQVWAVWTDSYSRPIPPAITDLRPARDTCEQCHWPAKFFGSQLKELVHFSPDEKNTRRVVRLLLKTGGADEREGRVGGIHMHMLVSGSIEYVATDDHLQEIPWVRYHTPDGQTVVYRADGKPSDAPPPAGTMRTIDCMDCHNRGAHHFRPPQAAINLQMDAGRIDPALPYIKREAVAALVGDYPDTATAEREIARRITTFYRENYPDLWSARNEAVRTAVRRIQEVYRRSFFPEMRSDWRTYPENIGHMISPGCFRCHDGLHVDARGQAISSSCTTCHDFLTPIEDRAGEFRQGGFTHSMNLVQHQKLRCNQCHTGGPLPLCYDCHATGQALENWRRGRLRRPPAAR